MRLLLLAAVACGLAACGVDSDDALTATSPTTTTSMTMTATATTTATATATAAATTITPQLVIQSFVFLIDAPVIAGQPIVITNRDGADHTFSDVDDSFEAYVAADATTTFVIDRPGTYDIWCRIHPDMRTTLTVG